MAIVADWQAPLEEALEEMLNNRDLSFSNLEDIRRALSMMDPADGRAADLVARLNQRVQQMDEEYQKAVLDAKSPFRDVVENAMARLQQLGVYKDAADKFQQGKEKIKQLPQEAQQLKDLLQEKTSSLFKSTADSLKSFRSKFKR